MHTKALSECRTLPVVYYDTTSLSKSYILILHFAVQGGEHKNIYDVCFISFTFILREGGKREKDINSCRAMKEVVPMSKSLLERFFLL